MRPIVTEECWICHQQFADKRQLKNHLASKSTHGGRLSVVCMWCLPYEKRFSRASDLRTHVEEKHSKEYARLEKDFFTEGNAYWMAIYPEDYRRIVTKVTKKGSRLAVEARNLVTDWASKCHSIRRTRAQWMSAWASHPRDEETGHTRESSVASSISDWAEEPEITIEEPRYDPACPSILKLYSVDMEQMTITLKVNSTRTTSWYVATVDPAIRDTERYMANLTRKAKIHRPIDTCMRSRGEVIISGKEFYTRRQDIAKIVTIPDIFITKIEKQESLEFTTNKNTTIVQSATSTITSPCQPSIAVENQAESPIRPIHRTPTASSSNTTTIANSTMNGDITTKQAKDILTMGCMPAVPSARREWAETTVKFSIGDTQIEWPPKNWKEMNSDKKLHAWEFVSTQLEFLLTGSFPTMERIDLLDKYNFLALPGTKEQKLRDKDNFLRKARYYNYECIREAATSQDTRFTAIVTMLFQTMDHRDKSLDKLLEQCNRRNIGLRLGSN